MGSLNVSRLIYESSNTLVAAVKNNKLNVLINKNYCITRDEDTILLFFFHS